MAHVIIEILMHKRFIYYLYGGTIPTVSYIDIRYVMCNLPALINFF